MADQATAGQPANGNAGAPQPQQQHQEDAPGGGAGQGQANGAPPSRFRQSQYAEAIANPLPELAVVPEPEPVANLSQLDCDDTASSTRAVVQPDDIGDPRGSAVVYAGEKPTLWRKYRGTVIIALVVAVLVLTGIVVGVVVSNAKNRSAGASPSTSPTPTSATGSSSVSITSSASATGSSVRSTVTSSVSVSSSSSASSSSTTSSLSVFPTPATSSSSFRAPPGQPSQAPVPSECADSSNFLTSVSFMGVKGAPGSGGWETAYYGGAKDSKDCCAYCYKHNSAGCNSWAYLPSSGFAGTACAMINGWDTGDDKDSTCPSGHGATVYFTTDSDNSSDVGAAGPCGVVGD